LLAGGVVLALQWHQQIDVQPWEPVMAGWRQAYFVAFSLLCIAPTGCARDTRADDEAAIRAATKDWNAAEEAKDLEKSLSFYAADGARYATGAPAIVGRQALRKEWQKYLSTPGSFHWRTARVEVSRSGDLAYETGNFVLKTIDPEGQAKTTNGKYVCVWRKQPDGQWKVVADIDNPDS
jgi:uncharacterized protein (TIGR02246 family)